MRVNGRRIIHDSICRPIGCFYGCLDVINKIEFRLFWAALNKIMIDLLDLLRFGRTCQLHCRDPEGCYMLCL
jgi:hypothetical protein